MASAYNFSKLESREKKVYAIADFKLSSSGWATKMLLIMGTLVTLSLLINCGIAMALNNWYFSPFKGNDIDPWPLVFIIGIPIGIGAILWFGKISHYRLIEFLYLYFKPRFTYSWDGKKVSYKKINMKAFLENKKAQEG